jgi:hypothetical protein
MLLSETPYVPLQMHAQLRKPAPLLLLLLLSPSQLLSCLGLLLLLFAAAAAVGAQLAGMPAAAALRLRLLHPAAAVACT